MRTTIVFDVEDYITPPEHELDDILKMLADVMTEEGVSGSFFMIGEKLRCLRDRGRRDVIEAIGRHDLGSHVNMGSIHPTLTERAETANWADGCARMAADELGGIDEMEALAGRPFHSLARHGGAFCPQLLAALGSRGLPYVYSPARLPGHMITWYCNTLNFAHEMCLFQEAYHSRDKFLAAEAEYLARAEELRREGCEWLGVFNSHPCHIKTTTFWDANYWHGANRTPEEWVVPGFYDEFDMAEVRRNWAFHCRRLREDPDLTVGTIHDFAQEFGAQAESADRAEIEALARRAAEADAPFWTDRFSAAEIVDLHARACVERERTGALPERLERRRVFGPTQMPLSVPTARRLAPEALLRAARGVRAAVGFGGVLPSRLRCGEGTLGSAGEIGVCSALVALGRALCGPADATVETRPVAPYPPEGDAIADFARTCRQWGPHKRDLDMADICRLAALQAWTLKPAWPGGVPEFGG